MGLTVARGRPRRVVRYPGNVLAMTPTPDDGGGPGPEPDPYIRTDYWASGAYGYIRRGNELVINQGTGDGSQTLPESIALPAVADAHALQLYIEIREIFGFYNVWDRKEARILIDGVVWKDWWAYESVPVLAGHAASWPPPGGVATVELRASFHPPDGAENPFDYRWTDVRILRYVITVSTPNPDA